MTMDITSLADQRLRERQAAARQAALRASALAAPTLATREAPSFRTADARDIEQNKGFFGRAFAAATSGEAFFNEILPGNPGSAVRGKLEDIPIVGGLAGMAADIAFSPLTAATAGLGPLASGAIRGGSVGARLARGLLQPVVSGGLGSRLAAETGVGLVGSVAAQTVAEKTGNPWLGAGAGLVGGGLALRFIGNVQRFRGLNAVDDLDVADPVRKLFEAVGKTKPQVLDEAATGTAFTRPKPTRYAGKANVDLPGAGPSLPGGSSRSALPGARSTIDTSDATASKWAIDRLNESIRALKRTDPASPEIRSLEQQIRTIEADPLVVRQQATRTADAGLPTGSSGRKGAVTEAPDLSPTTNAPTGTFRPEVEGNRLNPMFPGVRNVPGTIMEPQDISELFRRVAENPVLSRGKGLVPEAEGALYKLLAGEQPSARELKLLDVAYGKNVSGLISPETGWQSALIEGTNLSRAIMSSMDLSAPLRQGALLLRRKEFWRAFKPMVLSFADEARALEYDEAIQDTMLRLGRDGDSLYIAPTYGSRNFLDREEAFMSSWAEQLPVVGDLVKRSERAYLTFLNKLRADSMESFVTKLKVEDPTARAALTDEMARWLNTASGRGNISPNSLIAHTNSIFFSPRWFMSRLEAMNPKMWWQADPLVRREMAADVAGFVGVGLTALGILKLAGKSFGFDVSVEMDPRSSDFGKGRVGNTRWDPWAGFQPIARYVAQLYSGERKTSSGKVDDVNRGETLGRFAQSKLAPVPGFLLDALRGESFVGEEFDISTAPGLSQQAAQRLLPLFAQDMFDAVRAEGAVGAIKTAPAFLGVGAQTYTSFTDKRDQLAREDFGVGYDRLTATEKGFLEAQHGKELAKWDTQSKDGEFRYEVEHVNEDVREQEREVMAAFERKDIDSRQLNAVMAEIAAQRAFRIKGIRDTLGFEDGTGLIDRWIDLRTQATVGGVTDYALLDQLQEEFKGQLTDPRDRRLVEDFSTFKHDPSAEPFLAAKRKIQTAGYWQQEQLAVEHFASAVERIAPGARTKTDLERMARQAATPSEGRRIEALLSRIEQRAKRDKEKLRRQDKELDAALGVVYGTSPYRPKLPGLGAV